MRRRILRQQSNNAQARRRSVQNLNNTSSPPTPYKSQVKVSEK
jgi:hypothetical protein